MMNDHITQVFALMFQIYNDIIRKKCSLQMLWQIRQSHKDFFTNGNLPCCMLGIVRGAETKNSG